MRASLHPDLVLCATALQGEFLAMPGDYMFICRLQLHPLSWKLYSFVATASAESRVSSTLLFPMELARVQQPSSCTHAHARLHKHARTRVGARTQTHARTRARTDTYTHVYHRLCMCWPQRCRVLYMLRARSLVGPHTCDPVCVSCSVGRAAPRGLCSSLLRLRRCEGHS
jgi:hypothetical protein